MINTITIIHLHPIILHNHNMHRNSKITKMQAMTTILTRLIISQIIIFIMVAAIILALPNQLIRISMLQPSLDQEPAITHHKDNKAIRHINQARQMILNYRIETNIKAHLLEK